MVNAATSTTVYEPVPYWAKLPHPMLFKEATSVAVDSNDNVYVFNRGNHPVIIFDKDGNFLETWGAGEFVRPHGITIDADDNLYLADDDAHVVEKRTKEGKLIFRIGEKGKAAAWQEGDPFNRPTHVAVHPDSGDLFISDGYGNSRVHKFDSDGKHITSWGEPGSREGREGEGCFSLAAFGPVTPCTSSPCPARLRHFDCACPPACPRAWAGSMHGSGSQGRDGGFGPGRGIPRKASSRAAGSRKVRSTLKSRWSAGSRARRASRPAGWGLASAPRPTSP